MEELVRKIDCEKSKPAVEDIPENKSRQGKLTAEKTAAVI